MNIECSFVSYFTALGTEIKNSYKYLRYLLAAINATSPFSCAEYKKHCTVD